MIVTIGCHCQLMCMLYLSILRSKNCIAQIDTSLYSNIVDFEL